MCYITYSAILMFVFDHQIEASEVWQRYTANNYLTHVLEMTELKSLELLMVLEFFFKLDDGSFYQLVYLLEDIDSKLVPLCCMSMYLRNHYSNLRYGIDP